MMISPGVTGVDTLLPLRSPLLWYLSLYSGVHGLSSHGYLKVSGGVYSDVPNLLSSLKSISTNILSKKSFWLVFV